MLGVGGALLLALGVVAAVDARYVTRREWAATLLDIQRQLSEIKAALGIGVPRDQA